MILVISPHTTYAAKRLVEECGIGNVECRVMDIGELVAVNFKIDINQFSVLYVRNPYFNPVRSPMPEGIGSRPGRLTSNGVNGSPEYLPQVVEFAKQFQAAGKKVVDTNIAEGKLGAGKWEDYLELQRAGLLIPKTTKQLTINNLRLTDYPFILKWQFGMKARNVFLVNDENQLTKLLPQHPQSEWLVQEFIKAEYEYKVITVGYKALPVVLRFGMNKNGFRTDFNHAGIIKAESIAQIIDLAETASKALGRELSKVDILQKGNQFYILEVNRFPGLDSFEELTKFNVIKHFLDYLQK